MKFVTLKKRYHDSTSTYQLYRDTLGVKVIGNFFVEITPTLLYDLINNKGFEDLFLQDDEVTIKDCDGNIVGKVTDKVLDMGDYTYFYEVVKKR